MGKQTFMVCCQQVICSPGHPFEILYGCDREEFKTREAAIKHGFEIRESDDFNIVVLKGGKVSAFCWMNDDMNDTDAITEFCAQNDFDPSEAERV